MLIMRTNNLFYAVLLMTAEYIHIRISSRKPHFLLRALSTATVICLISVVLPEACNALWAMPFNFFVHALLFGLTVLGSAVCYEMDPFYMVSRCLFGYLTYNVAHIFALLFKATFQLDETSSYYVMVAVTFAVTYTIFAISSVRRISSGMRRMRWKFQIAGVFLLVMTVFSYVSLDIHQEAVVSYFLPTYFFVVYLCMLLLHIFADEKHLHDDYEMTKQLLKKEAHQYEVSKELIDRINQKAHDLKYQIHHLSVTSDSEALQELEEIIDAYDTNYKTGNDAVDVIMTEKIQQCQKHHIRIVCIIDGEKLNGMEPWDIYSLLGNILDNAIEALLEVPDEDKRIINLSIKQEFGMVRIRTENYYIGPRNFQRDLPMTTKTDHLWHGYGTRSILTIAEKYGGVAEFGAENGIFTVNVLVPTTFKSGQ